MLKCPSDLVACCQSVSGSRIVGMKKSGRIFFHNWRIVDAIEPDLLVKASTDCIGACTVLLESESSILPRRYEYDIVPNDVVSAMTGQDIGRMCRAASHCTSELSIAWLSYACMHGNECSVCKLDNPSCLQSMVAHPLSQLVSLKETNRACRRADTIKIMFILAVLGTTMDFDNHLVIWGEHKSFS